MRSLGDMSWLNNYVGIPYAFGGRDKDGLDCYGLAKLVYAEQYGETLPDWVTDVLDLKVRHKEFISALEGNEFVEKETPEDGDFVVCYGTKAAHHMGLFFGGGVLHCVDNTGVVYEPLSRFNKKYTKVIFGEWTPCP